MRESVFHSITESLETKGKLEPWEPQAIPLTARNGLEA